MGPNYVAYQVHDAPYSYGADCSGMAMASPEYEHQFCSLRSHTGRPRLEIDVEPVDLEMSLDIEEQAALSAQRERDERRCREGRNGVCEGHGGHQMPPVVYSDGYHGPDVPLGCPIYQNTNRNSETPQHIRVEEQCGPNQKAPEVEMDFRPCADDKDEPCEHEHSYTHIHTGDRVLTLRIPYLGPVGWTVPARDGPQTTRPFLIYQDPTAGYRSPPPPPTAKRPIGERVHLLASDDKENVAEDMDENEEEGNIPDHDASYVEDNMVAEAESIVELAAMNDGWDLWTLRNRPQHLSLSQGGPGYGHGHDLDHQYGHGHGLQHNPQQDDEPEIEYNVAVGGSLEASPVRSQRAHSNSIVIVSPPRRASRLDDGDAGNAPSVRWNGSPRAGSSLFF
ncbi:uncharacterized protein BDCG_04125 [Blastomyces dermatitidis ER-3]|uniref:Uncharacterized protein n=1 Tax=Ajellomyces dermatitidis (strain ER-3 / ATCC MYA-2586) TaxID=559297 RepID=A0ABP2EXW1_AJEDR|nr:uncharacterized protein BDCG_04125 [Blastomyces dermatitidis ER-3]EEQ89005.1 hypothetical protein BDCG_04125 [Blastomyces dermatitidis ER-3]